jgi:hypothetical protein
MLHTLLPAYAVMSVFCTYPIKLRPTAAALLPLLVAAIDWLQFKRHVHTFFVLVTTSPTVRPAVSSYTCRNREPIMSDVHACKTVIVNS